MGLISSPLLLAALVLSTGWSAPRLSPAGLSKSTEAVSPTTSAPRTPPAVICGDASLLAGPTRPPRGSRVLKAGYDDFAAPLRPDTTYWFAPGAHTLGSGKYAHIVPVTGDRFIGAPGAVIDGRGINQSTFAGTATHVTIKYLTIKDFVPPQDQGAVNHDSGANWTVEYDTIEDNGGGRGSNLGAGLMMGSGDVYKYNCLTHNGEYGLNAVATTSPRNIIFSHNEVSYNGAAEFPDKSCGCSGGAKFWATINAVVEDNYVHDNYNVGLWFDTDNEGALVRANYLTRNWAEGLAYEISYNAHIEDNTFVDNSWGIGSFASAGFPMSALYISGSAGNSAVDGGRYSTLTVASNVFTNNWGGVVIYYDPNRVCGSSANTSTGSCTLKDPAVFSASSCSAHDGPLARPGDSPDYYNGCQWNADNIDVEENIFSFDPHKIQTATDTLPDIDNSKCYSGPNRLDTSSSPPTGNSYWCGFNGLFSSVGSTAPYFGWAGPDAIMGLTSKSDFGQVDTIRFANNTYQGPWSFQAYAQGQSPVDSDLYPHGVRTTVSFAAWRSTWGQDKGSRIR